MYVYGVNRTIVYSENHSHLGVLLYQDSVVVNKLLYKVLCISMAYSENHSHL